MWLVERTRSGGERPCCRRILQFVDLVLLLRAMRKACSLLCVMHESILVSTSGHYAATLGFQKLLDQTTEWCRLATIPMTRSAYASGMTR